MRELRGRKRLRQLVNRLENGGITDEWGGKEDSRQGGEKFLDDK